ncbi:D,D-heptose 1,7-bisphosphate phosphatase, partial [Campylobacter jejuni]|nr:D,D-heptose 1,7-bisphosphate phosphatase [Campylobacter jejuni]EGH7390298.1 D,D-heptose 1,7-bisphosphate phosphatase [Campylobacter jejuni]EIP7489837.1 D,D-heptose 1,7-bisphosphate phosphatase [Campylobacter jejuni]EIZ8010201.1 D,D-heptose 1,7-bisphosphate phosphatase [Campylobacter jejuni]HEF8543547.1 D,D-heptose 1,7-bisphosphate phosphatase [Campylobacter jejuni]
MFIFFLKKLYYNVFMKTKAL